MESRFPQKTLWHGLLDEAIFRPFYQIDNKGYQILGDLDKKVIAQGLWKLPKLVHSDSKKIF